MPLNNAPNSCAVISRRRSSSPSNGIAYVPSSKALRPYREPVAIPIQNLDPVTTPVGEHEQMSGESIQLHHRVHQRVQPVEAPPHIARRGCQVHTHAGRQMDHRGSRNTLSTSHSVAASTPGAIRTRSPVGQHHFHRGNGHRRGAVSFDQRELRQ